MNATFQSIIVASCKALFASGANSASSIARLLNAPGETKSEERLALKALFAANAYSSSSPPASDSSIEIKLRSYVGLSAGGETISVTIGAGPRIYSVS